MHVKLGYECFSGEKKTNVAAIMPSKSFIFVLNIVGFFFVPPFFIYLHMALNINKFLVLRRNTNASI